MPRDFVIGLLRNLEGNVAGYPMRNLEVTVEGKVDP